jgi:cytochrome b subunit of formate dehydrogenase
MNYRRFLHGAKFWFWVALFVAYSAGAVGLVMIDTYEDRYRSLSKVKLTSVKATEDVRRAGASQVAAVYRAQSGMWPDGSTETMVIVDPTSSLGVAPVKRSQVTAADAAR